MFAMHNDFRSEATRRFALTGRGYFKTAQSIVNRFDARFSYRVISEKAGGVDFNLVKSVMQNPQGIFLIAQDRLFGPYLPDDLILLAD